MSLISFYGQECPHCERMESVVQKLEHDTGVCVERREVWHDKENMAVLTAYDKGVCGGVPYFYNTETGKSLCGEVSIDELKAWAKQ